ncbi:MAG: glycosyltransferase family 4 protein, partial [Deltaproteobacteria bacterium]|nr:glycosyltransferase family 4 protein [Deltaproteobacteria bacterium]
AAGLADIPLGRRVKPRLVRNWQSDAAVRLADAVGCLSREDAAYLGLLGVPADRVFPMANGVDAGTFNPAARAGLAGRVLFIGGWLEVKGRRLVEAAWPVVHARHPGARLTLLGTGAGEAEVLADFPPECRASVRVLPRVEEEGAVARELAAHEVFVMPSVSEGSPLALLEAMASGLPAVATRVGGIPDVLDDGVEGLTVPPLDVAGLVRALGLLLADPARAAALGQAARRRAEGLTWEATASALEAACARAQGRQAS